MEPVFFDYQNPISYSLLFTVASFYLLNKVYCLQIKYSWIAANFYMFSFCSLLNVTAQ